MKILAIAAHPDDEVLGCGGTLARESGQHDVRVVILGEGITSRAATRDGADPSALATLQTHSEQAAAVMGARGVEFGGLPDNRFDSLPLLDVVKLVERHILAFAPDVIYTHHPGDLNVDHGVTFRAVLTATRPGAGGPPVSAIYSFEVASSTEWAFQHISPAFRPNVFVDISETLDRKIEAMECYRSEARTAPHPRAPESLRAIAARWGSVIGVRYAEAFELIRQVR